MLRDIIYKVESYQCSIKTLEQEMWNRAREANEKLANFSRQYPHEVRTEAQHIFYAKLLAEAKTWTEAIDVLWSSEAWANR